MCEVAERVSDETVRKLEALTTGWHLVAIRQLIAERAVVRERMQRLRSLLCRATYIADKSEPRYEQWRDEAYDALKLKAEPDGPAREKTE